MSAKEKAETEIPWASASRRESNTDDVPLMNRVREMILSGDLLPGQRVTEEGLAEQLGVSRTPVRNVLPTLASQGFLKLVGRRGYAVKEFSETETWEALELRALLEGQAGRLLAQKGASPETFGALEACLQAGDRLFDKRHLDREDEQHYGAMNGEFHRIIVAASDSPMLTMFIDRLNLVPFVAPSVIVFDDVGYRRAFDLLFRAHGCHHAIVEAIRERDPARTEILFREHAHQQKLSMFSRRAQHSAIEIASPASR
jgi:GntR family transcriptional regulator, vanillate catabolism transcriptional regulator